MKRATSIFFILFLILAPLLAFGVETEIDYPAVSGTAPAPAVGTSFPAYAKYLFNLGLALSGIIALAVIAWAGFLYLTSVDNPERKKEAERKILAGLLGLIILLVAYSILATINPQLLILSIGEVTPASTSTTSPPSLPTSTFVEIPLGTLIEDIGGEDVSCLRFTPPPDASIELSDCQSEGPLKPEAIDDSPLVLTSPLSLPLPTSTIFVGTTTFFGSTSTYYYYSSSTKIFSTSSDFRFCYTYDSDGNKSGVLLNKDRYDCLENLLSALKRKAEILEVLVLNLKEDLAEDLNASSTLLDAYAETLRYNAGALKGHAIGDPSYPDSDPCACPNCSLPDKECGSCPTCTCSGDPCPDRDEMETLRTKTLPKNIADVTSTIPGILSIEEQINKKRDEIRAFIFGADPTIDLWYYATSMDPRVTPSFMPFNEGIIRLKEHIDYLKRELDDLEKAEEKMKSPYGDRLTLMEFLRIKKEHSEEEIITTQEYLTGRYDIAKYCWESNCNSTDTNGVCLSCSTSTEGRLCGIKNGREQFVFDGDPATFYLNENYLEEPVISKKEKCTIDQALERGFPKGLIPIGQAVDQAEELAYDASSSLDSFYYEVVFIKEKALDAREQAFQEIENVNNQIKEITGDIYGVYDQGESGRNTNSSTTTIDKIDTTTEYEIHYVSDPDQLIDLTSTGTSPTDDCVDQCSVVCTSPCTPEDSGVCCEESCSTDSSGHTHCHCVKNTYNCICETCEGTVCPSGKIATAYASVVSHYSSSNNYHNAAKDNFETISDDYDAIEDSVDNNLPTYKDGFIEAVLIPEKVLLRCKILDKLNIARERLQKCLTGFSFASKEGKIKNRVFGARMGLHLEYSGKLVILPDFPIPAKAYNASACSPPSCLNAYPYNSEELSAGERQACYNNKDSGACWDAIGDYLEDYYCCQWVP